MSQSPAGGITLAIRSSSSNFQDRIQPQAWHRRLKTHADAARGIPARGGARRCAAGRPKGAALPRQQAAQRREGLDGQAQVPAGRLAGGGSPAARRRVVDASRSAARRRSASHATHARSARSSSRRAPRRRQGRARVPPGASSAIARLKILPSDTVRGLPAAEWFAWCVIIFGSSAVGSAVDGRCARRRTRS